jgi:phosphoglucomutase
MAIIRHSETGIIIGDPDRIPLSDISVPQVQRELEEVYKTLILSGSGWRTVFAQDGDEESSTVEIKSAHRVIVALGAALFARLLKQGDPSAHPKIVVGIDTRPTGPAIADVMIRAFLAQGCTVEYPFIICAPEIMAYTAYGSRAEGEQRADGFAYVSASHNPIGHNGIKFGRNDGGVLSGEEAKGLIADFRRTMEEEDPLSMAIQLMETAQPKQVSRVYAQTRDIKRRSNSAYLLFTREVVCGVPQPQEQDKIFDVIGQTLTERPVGIVADFNGSARTLALDGDILSSLGLRFLAIHGTPGKIAHRIVPEGVSLEPCRLELEKKQKEDPAFTLGYVCDCDGDRGNLVIWDDKLKQARSLEAQEVFSLCCVAELAHLVWTDTLRYDRKGNAIDRVAIAVNDPTSMRVDAIAQAFDVSVFRAEVGEANVVGLARKLRTQGYRVRILGEGAAGGNITHPSAVRDPIDTVFALLKLLSIRSTDTKPGLFELWCALSNQTELYNSDFTLSDIIATLPAYSTTSAYQEEAILRIKTEDHGLLKSRYQQIFLREWETQKEALASRFNIYSWEALAYNGLEERRQLTQFSDAGRGGLKILFFDREGHPNAYIWMRGSGTEPVFRVMADVKGTDMKKEQELLQWQRRMVLEADGSASNGR